MLISASTERFEDACKEENHKSDDKLIEKPQESGKEIHNLKKILIVDDEQFNMLALEIILEHMCKFTVDEKTCSFAKNGKEALDIIREDA